MVWEIILSGVFILIGVGVGYVFANLTARKQRLYEVKQQAYGEMFPRLEELITIVTWLHDSEALKLEDQDLFAGNLIALLIPPFVLADTDTIRELDETSDEYADTKKGQLELLQAVQEKVRSMLVVEMYSIARDLRYELAPLAFVRSDPKVSQLRSQLFSMLQEDQTTFGLRSLFKPLGLESLIPRKDMASRLGEYRRVLEDLKGAIEQDLDRIL